MPLERDPHHPAAVLGEFSLLQDARVIRVPMEHGDMRLLQIHHPRHGWLSFIIETGKAQELGKLLEASVRTPDGKEGRSRFQEPGRPR